MNFQALYQEVDRRVHGNTGNASYLNEIKTALNLGRKSIVALLSNADFLQVEADVALVNGQMEYSLASDVGKVNPEEIRLSTSRVRLTHLDPNAEGFLSSLVTPDTPKHFRLSGYKMIQLYPPPNSAAVSAETNFSYEYTKTFPTDMSSDGDTHGLPPHMEPALLDLAESLVWTYLRKLEYSQFVFQKALTQLQAYSPQSEFFKILSLNVSPPDLRVSQVNPPNVEGVT